MTSLLELFSVARWKAPDPLIYLPVILTNPAWPLNNRKRPISQVMIKGGLGGGIISASNYP